MLLPLIQARITTPGGGPVREPVVVHERALEQHQKGSATESQQTPVRPTDWRISNAATGWR